MDIQVKALLDAIHQHHILRLGPAEYLQVQQLLEVRPDLSRTEFQVALASLLATNREQWQQIVGLFKEYYPEATTSDPSQPRPGLSPSGPVEGAGLSTLQTPLPIQSRWQLRETLARVWRHLRNAPRWLLFLMLACGLSVKRRSAARTALATATGTICLSVSPTPHPCQPRLRNNGPCSGSIRRF